MSIETSEEDIIDELKGVWVKAATAYIKAANSTYKSDIKKWADEAAKQYAKTFYPNFNLSKLNL